MVTREEVVKLMTKFIKEESKGDFKVKKLSISIDSWGSRIKGVWTWTRTNITIGRDKYEFTDKEIKEDTFVYMLRTALEQSGVHGNVFFDTYGDGCWVPKETRFNKIEIYGKACKEFTQLNKLLVKLDCKPLNDLDVFYVRVCGKRSSWSDSGRVSYLMHDAKTCQHIMDDIKSKKVRGGVVCAEVKEWFSHGDETDYNYAQYAESEWYGARGAKLVLTYKTSKGVVRNVSEFYTY